MAENSYPQRILTIIFAIITLTLLLTSPTRAVTTGLTTPTDTLDPELFTLHVRIDGAGEGKNYLKVDVASVGSKSYFGYTFNGDVWIDEGPYTSFFPIEIDSSHSWEGSVQAKVDAHTISGGTLYSVRIRRYTSSGSYSATEANQGSIQVYFSPQPSEGEVPPDEIEPTDIVATTQPTLPPQNVSFRIFLTEVMVNPAIPEQEWIELYNDGEEEIRIENWFIDDEIDGGSSPKQFSLTIAGHHYATIDLSSSIFNNDGDQVRVLDSNGNLISDFSYSSSQKGYTFATTGPTDTSYCLQSPSKGYENSGCMEEKPTIAPTTTSSQPTTPPTTSATTDSKQGGSSSLSSLFPKQIPILENALFQSSPTVDDLPVATIAGINTQSHSLTANVYASWSKALSASAAGIAALNVLYIIARILHAEVHPLRGVLYINRRP